MTPCIFLILLLLGLDAWLTVTLRRQYQTISDLRYGRRVWEDEQ